MLLAGILLAAAASLVSVSLHTAAVPSLFAWRRQVAYLSSRLSSLLSSPQFAPQFASVRAEVTYSVELRRTEARTSTFALKSTLYEALKSTLCESRALATLSSRSRLSVRAEVVLVLGGCGLVVSVRFSSRLRSWQMSSRLISCACMHPTLKLN